MNCYEDRLGSYQGRWPATALVAPERLADAGFFYKGAGDKVSCYVCGGRLVGWEHGDDPWTEHRVHFPNCNLVRERFGESKEAGYDEPWHQPGESKKPGYDEPWHQPGESKEAGYDEPWHQPEESKEAGYDEPWHQPEESKEAGYDEPWHQPRESNEAGYDEPWHQPGDGVAAKFVFMAIEMGFPSEKVNRVANEFDFCGKDIRAFLEAIMKTPDSVVPSAPPAEMKDVSLTDQDRLLCKVCMERKANTLFLPCAHIVCCVQCAGNFHQCPVCRLVWSLRLDHTFCRRTSL